MTACFCSSCCATPAPTYTVEHQRACEARAVLDIPSLDKRRDYLKQIEKLRGADGRLALEQLMQAEFLRRRVA